MNKRDQDASSSGTEPGFLLMVICCLALFAWILFEEAASRENWLILPILASTFPIVHLLTQRGPHVRR